MSVMRPASWLAPAFVSKRPPYKPPPVLKVAEDFTAADGTDMQGKAPSPTSAGGNWGNPHAGYYLIYGNAVRPVSGDTRPCYCNSTIADGTFSIDLLRKSGTWQAWNEGGIAFRANGSFNFWTARLTATRWSLGNWDTGYVFTEFDGKAFTTSINTTYTISVVCNGNSITATINGANALYATSSKWATNTYHGFYTYANAVDNTYTLDNFSVYTL